RSRDIGKCATAAECGQRRAPWRLPARRQRFHRRTNENRGRWPETMQSSDARSWTGWRRSTGSEPPDGSSSLGHDSQVAAAAWRDDACGGGTDAAARPEADGRREAGMKLVQAFEHVDKFGAIHIASAAD